MIKVLFFLGMSLFAQTPPPPSDIVYGVNMDFAMPLVGVNRVGEKPQLIEGIIKDIGDAIFKELKVEPKFSLLPKKRVAPSLVSGKVSFICHTNEAWQPLIKDEVLWSETLYKSDNWVVFTKGKAPRKISDLNGQRVGVILNFVYLNLDSSFEQKLVLREDSPNTESNLNKLLKGRLSYIIMSNIEYEYYKKKYPQLQFADVQIGSFMTKCALSRNSKLSLKSLNKAIERIKENGTLDRILKKYH
ncbi:membrane-bound lytic transglycosylase F [compost metagenome]